MRRVIPFVRFAAVAIVMLGPLDVFAQTRTSTAFAGAKVNGGTVTYVKEGMSHRLTLSDDFKVPDTPDPHWQIVDAKGRVYLLQKLTIKGDKLNKSIVLPAYITDVARVQMWCSWAEVLLGEASFGAAVQLTE